MYSFSVAVARATLVVLVYDSDVTHVCAKKRGYQVILNVAGVEHR